MFTLAFWIKNGNIKRKFQTFVKISTLCHLHIHIYTYADHATRNDDVIVGVAVKPNLKNRFFLKAIQNLGKLKEFQLLSICSLGFVCRYVELWVTLIPPPSRNRVKGAIQEWNSHMDGWGSLLAIWKIFHPPTIWDPVY